MGLEVRISHTFDKGSDGRADDDVGEFGLPHALATLGANVTEPAAAGREDGRLVDPAGREAVLEIKGVGRGIKLDHVRELREWTDDMLAQEGCEAKGLLIANVLAAQPPSDRGAPVAGGTLGLAKRWQQCLFTTTQLFAAIVADQERGLDREAFWRAVFDTDGVAPLPDAGM
jgi:hypothetical protein